MLDHGLYFDLDPELRVNYSNLWLSLISPASPSTTLNRRKYAELVGNIGPDLVGIIAGLGSRVFTHIYHSTLSSRRLSRAEQHLKEPGMAKKKMRRSGVPLV